MTLKGDLWGRVSLHQSRVLTRFFLINFFCVWNGSFPRIFKAYLKTCSVCILPTPVPLGKVSQPVPPCPRYAFSPTLLCSVCVLSPLVLCVSFPVFLFTSPNSFRSQTCGHLRTWQSHWWSSVLRSRGPLCRCEVQRFSS